MNRIENVEMCAEIWFEGHIHDNVQTYFKRIDRSKDDFSKMLFFTNTKDGHLLESNIFRGKRIPAVAERVAMDSSGSHGCLPPHHKFKERGVTTIVHCSSGHDHVTYLRIFFFPSVSQQWDLFFYPSLYIYIFIFIRLLSRSGNSGISSSVHLYCVVYTS